MFHNLFNRKPRGFTLIELVIVIVILGISLSTLALLFSQVMKTYLEPEVMQVATQLAEEKMEEVSSLRYSVVTDIEETAFSGEFSNYSYEVRVTAVPTSLAVDPGMDDYKEVQVIVSNDIIGSITLTTIVTNN